MKLSLKIRGLYHRCRRRYSSRGFIVCTCVCISWSIRSPCLSCTSWHPSWPGDRPSSTHSYTRSAIVSTATPSRSCSASNTPGCWRLRWPAASLRPCAISSRILRRLSPAGLWSRNALSPEGTTMLLGSNSTEVLFLVLCFLHIRQFTSSHPLYRHVV